MKKFRLSALVLAGALSLSLLTACGGGEDAPVEPTDAPMESMEPEAELPDELPEIIQTPSETGDAVIDGFWNTLIEKQELPDLMDLDADLLKEIYGIDAADLDVWFCKMPLMNTQATEFFVAKVSADKMDAVTAALEARQDALEEQWKMYLPEQLELVENYKLVTAGDYVLFAISYDVDNVVDCFSAAAAQ